MPIRSYICFQILKILHYKTLSIRSTSTRYMDPSFPHNITDCCPNMNLLYNKHFILCAIAYNKYSVNCSFVLLTQLLVLICYLHVAINANLTKVMISHAKMLSV